METIESLERKLACAKKHEPVGAKYQTGLVIDIKRPQGNIFYLFGVANDLVRKLALSAEEKAEFERERNSQTSYQGHQDIMRKWFGIIFVENSDDDE